MNAYDRTDALAGLSILVLEDEVLVAMAMKDDLEEAGAEVVDLARTQAMARRFLDKEYSVAVLDVRVPDGTSYDLAMELLAQGTGVVFHSGHAEKRAVRDFKRAVFCMKPTTPEELVHSILTARRLVTGG